MKISEALQGVQRLALDTAPYIYYVQNHPLYADKMDRILVIVESANIEITTSVIALTETLVNPFKSDDLPLMAIYRELFEATGYIIMIPVSAELAERAAELRARYQLRTPDALHMATAITSNCDAFLTNDLGFKRVTALRVLILDDLTLDEPEENPDQKIY